MKKRSSQRSDNARRVFEFSFPNLDTLVQVEECGDEVFIRTTRNTFSERRKVCFLHELAAEGFISDAYQWFAGTGEWPSQHVRWQVDCSWLKVSEAAAARTRRFMLILLTTGLLLWCGMMARLFLW